MLVVFSGLPGVGKTTLAKELASYLKAVYIRIDTIEQSMKDAKIAVNYDESYRVAFNIARDNLMLGQTVVADSTNPVFESREAWWQVAEDAIVNCIDIEVICSDNIEHRRRVESRQSDIPNLKIPSWQSVTQREYDNWEATRHDHPFLRIDTAGVTKWQAFDTMLSALRNSHSVI